MLDKCLPFSELKKKERGETWIYCSLFSLSFDNGSYQTGAGFLEGVDLLWDHCDKIFYMMTPQEFERVKQETVQVSERQSCFFILVPFLTEAILYMRYSQTTWASNIKF